MSSTPAKKTDAVDLNAYELRLPRFKTVEIGAPFNLVVGERHYRIHDISESGFSLEADETDNFAESKEILGKILHNDSSCIYEGRIERIRNNRKVMAFRFLDHNIPRKLFEAIEDLNSIQNEVALNQADVSLPVAYKALIIDMRDYLFHLKQHMDELDDRLRVESAAVKDSYLEALNLVVFPGFMERMQEFSRQLNELDKTFNAEQKARALALFQKHVREYYEQSDFVTRSLRRPLGYAGDFILMTKIYDNEYVGASMFSKLMYKWGINEISSQAVRYRRGLFVERLKNLSHLKRPRIASIACGPAREIKDFLQLPEKTDLSPYDFYLIDQDHQALLEAKRDVISEKLSRQLDHEFHFLPVSVKDIIEGNTVAGGLQRIGFDFIYSAGLYDYLSQKAARYLTKNLCSWLAPGGSLIVGNYNRLNPSHAIGEYVGNWSLTLRDEAEMVDLVPEGASYKIHYDDHRVNIYLEVIRDAK